MKPSSLWVLVILVMALLGALFAWALGSFEPRYEGLSANQYLRAVLNTNATPSATQTAIKLVPTRVAVPILIQFPQAQDPRWRGWYQRLYPRLPVILQKRLGPPKSSDFLVQRSVTALGYFGAEARAAVPQLLRLEAACDRNATNASKAGGNSSMLQRQVIKTLGEIGPAAKEAIPHWIEHLQQPPRQRSANGILFSFGPGDHAHCLAKLDPSGEQSGPALVAALRNRYWAATALDALAEVASNSPRWIDDLWGVAENASSPLAIRAAQHVVTLGGFTRERVGIILPRTSHPDPQVRRHAAEILQYAGRYAPEAVPSLVRLARDSDETVRRSATRALAPFARDQRSPRDLRLAAARSALDHNDPVQTWEMLVIIAQLGSAEVTIDDILPFLSDSNERLRAKAAETLGSVGIEDERACPALEQLLADKWESVRDAARSALVQRQRPWADAK